MTKRKKLIKALGDLGLRDLLKSEQEKARELYDLLTENDKSSPEEAPKKVRATRSKPAESAGKKSLLETAQVVEKTLPPKKDLHTSDRTGELGKGIPAPSGDKMPWETDNAGSEKEVVKEKKTTKKALAIVKDEKDDKLPIGEESDEKPFDFGSGNDLPAHLR